jgi:hypothetical protein
MKEYTRAALTPAQIKEWNTTKLALLWQCPAFTHVLYTMMDNSHSEHVAVFTDEVNIAATDGSALLLNPTKFFAYVIKKRVYIVAHEICHAIFDHCGIGYKMRLRGKVTFPDGTELPYDAMTMNIATDLIINDMLIAAGIGEYDKSWLHDTSLGTHKDSALDVYRKVYQSSEGGGGGGNRFDDHLDPGAADGKDAHGASNARNAKEWASAVAAGAAAAKAQGKLPAGGALSDFFDRVLNPEVPWADKIEAFFSRKVGSGSYDWRRPDRRLIVQDIYAPGRSGHGAGLVVVAVDTSGSIYADKSLLKRFFTELRGILDEVKPKRMLVMWTDAAVHSVEEIDDMSDLTSLKPKGGGGTDFAPAFQWIADEGLEPDALVYLTDGYGPFPKTAPSYPTLWGNISPELKPTHYPFGEVVTVPLQKAA